jgi:hypothetical protein
MLKRQRASSPLPLTQATAMELSLLSLDPPSSEHGAKRRRILTPPLDGPSHGRGLPPVLPVDDVDEDDTMNDGTPRLWGTVVQQSLECASEYKMVNSLLHDLHAEQQHRRLMSLSPHPSSSSPGPSYHGWSPSTPGQLPIVKPSFAPNAYPNSIEDVPLSEKYRQDAHPSEAMSGSCCADDVSVYDLYEETNRLVRFLLRFRTLITALSSRYLGSVFLERRRDLSTSVGS